jgi:hypothetical protein
MLRQQETNQLRAASPTKRPENNFGRFASKNGHVALDYQTSEVMNNRRERGQTTFNDHKMVGEDFGDGRDTTDTSPGVGKSRTYNGNRG